MKGIDSAAIRHPFLSGSCRSRFFFFSFNRSFLRGSLQENPTISSRGINVADRSQYPELARNRFGSSRRTSGRDCCRERKKRNISRFQRPRRPATTECHHFFFGGGGRGGVGNCHTMRKGWSPEANGIWRNCCTTVSESQVRIIDVVAWPGGRSGVINRGNVTHK